MLQSDEVYLGIHTQQFTYSSQFRWGSIEFVAESGDTLSYSILHLYRPPGTLVCGGTSQGKTYHNIASRI